ncbi:MAG: SPOR domain-containing protein [Gammaproteobacteria bacterium]|nr:SPOR domain-containing protein [Gammaproteobacteria bacterium]
MAREDKGELVSALRRRSCGARGAFGAALRPRAAVLVLVCALGMGTARAEEPAAGLIDPGAGGDVVSLLARAEQGDARAAFLLGMRYALGRDTERDDVQALRWLEIAAEEGLAEAQYNLGVIHAGGRGVTPDVKLAARWYAAAAEQGLARAQYNLGTLYALGVGVDRDEVEAARWFRRAAEQGVPQAAYNLGVLYEYGRGVEADAEQAAEWYRRGAEGGYLPAGERLAALNVRGDVAVSEVQAEPGSGAWLASRDPARYTLQILSHTDEDAVRRFVEERFPGGEANYFAFERDGTTWYSVVYGDYASVSEAREAIPTLAPGLQALDPWVRKISAILRIAIRENSL